MPDDSRPTSGQLQGPRQEPKNIQSILQSPGTLARFKQILPRHLSAERMLRVSAMAIHNTPGLAACEPITLLGSLMACASLGLEPNTPLGHAYLIPFKKSKKVNGRWIETQQVQLIIGYKGYIDLARRSGSMVSIHADVVYQGDEFSFEYGTNQHLKHIPKGLRGDRKPTFAYAHVKLTDGEAFEVLPYEEVLEIRNASQGYSAALAAKKEAESDPSKAFRMKSYSSSPWVAHEHEMAAKTMIRRVSKYLPLSLEFATAIAVDGAADRGTLDLEAIGIDPGKLIEGEVSETGDEDDEGEQTGDQGHGQQGQGQQGAQAKTAEQPKDPATEAKPKAEPEQKAEPQQTQQSAASTASDKPAARTRAKNLFKA